MSEERVALPKTHRPKIVLWNDLNPEVSGSLINAPTLKEVRDILAEIFTLHNYLTVYREQILLNLYTYAVQFAREEKFTSEQLSAYFSILKNIHEACIESPFGNLDETFLYFKDLLLCHSVYRPPTEIELFSVKEVRKISYHVINTYFRHFKLYKYAFTPQVWLDLSLNYVGETDSDTSQETDTDLDKVEKVESECNVSQESSEKEPALTIVAQKEEAKKYLRKVITEFLQERINELKSSVQEKLKHTEQTLNDKLEDAGYRDNLKKNKRYSKTGKK